MKNWKIEQNMQIAIEKCYSNLFQICLNEYLDIQYHLNDNI